MRHKLTYIITALAVLLLLRGKYVMYFAKLRSPLQRFFKPQTVQRLGDFQDGGLQHNNPSDIAQWEARFIWPRKNEPEFTLSLGTGTSVSVSNRDITTKPKFYTRLFQSYLRTLDSEEAYRRFYNSLPVNSRYRYHRLNVRFSGPEPFLDDAEKIPELKENFNVMIRDTQSLLLSVIDSMLAAMFYFELDGPPALESSEYICTGHIFCRLDLPKEGLRELYIRVRDTSLWFLIQGCSVSCSQGVPTGIPPFKRRVDFVVKTRDKLISFCLRGITSVSKPISGFSTTLEKLIRD
jgi:hypothetical protein